MPHLHNKLDRAVRRLGNWYLSHTNWFVGFMVALACTSVIGYQVYAYNQAQKNKHTQVVVQKLSKGQCVQTKFFYGLLNNLVLDTGPHYGSPDGGPIVPGARTKAINKLFSLERQSVKKLRAQGCDTTGVIPKNIR